MLVLLSILALLGAVSASGCECNLSGTIGSLSTCEGNRRSSSCNCRPSVIRETNCDSCYPQFYSLSTINVFGCQRCSCDLGGSLSPECDYRTGQCQCREGIGGRDCDRPNTGTYVPALYHINSNIVLEDSISGLNLERGPAQINGVIEPHDIADIPPRFELLFNEYPVPISFEQMEGVSKNAKKKRKARKSRKARSLLDTEPILKEIPHQISKRQASVMFATEVEFSHPGIYFLVLNYTATQDTSVSVMVGELRVPTHLPQCDKCLIMLAGSLGVKGIQVGSSGSQSVKISSPSSGVSVHYTVALPKEYYFTSSLKQDVSPRCLPGPFTQLCNRYRYPITGTQHTIEEAEDWLEPEFQPAYTGLAGVNLFGRLNSNDNEATNRMRIDVRMQPGSYYYLIVKYYKPHHYINYEYSFTASVSLGDSQGEIEFIPCPWEEGCRAVATNRAKKLQLFQSLVSRTATLNLKVGDESMVFIDSIMLVQEDDWNLDHIQAQFYCIQGPDNECLPSEFIDLRDYVMYESESAIDAVKMKLRDTFYHGTGVMLLDQNSPSLSVVVLENTITRNQPEDYVVIVHYFKYTSDVARGTVNIQDINNSQADVLYKFCPSASGCRVAATISGQIQSAVVSHNPSWTGYWTPLPVTGGDTRIIVTLSLTHAESVYVDYLSLVPLKDFHQDMLYHLPLDHGPLFTQYCAYHYLYLNPEPELESYCKKVSFSMTTMFNNGTLECDCSEVGSLSNTCDQETGQCPCKPGFGGRVCDQCEAAHYGYPDCTSCDCDPDSSLSANCDQETGQCECETNFSGRQCTECGNDNYGYLNDRLTCDIPCGCDQQGSVGTSCHYSTGQCTCNDDAAGLKCNECKPGHYRFPACYDCDCNESGSLGSDCDITGQCDCKEGYYGPKCDECSEDTYFNGTHCADCPCAVDASACESHILYAHEETEAFDDGNFYGITYEDLSGTLTSSSGLSVVRYQGNNVLLVELSPQEDITYLVLPERFGGDKRSVETQKFSFDVTLRLIEDVDIQVETMFQGERMTLYYRAGWRYTTTGPRTEPSDQYLKVEIPLKSNTAWRIYGDNTRLPSNEEIQSVLQTLQLVRINTRMHDGQEIVIIDNIKQEYLSEDKSDGDRYYYPVCICGEGYEGELCESCAPTFFRDPETGLCDSPCECNGNSEICDELGICKDCQNNTQGDHCEECADGHYYSSKSEQCEPCQCSGNGVTSGAQSCVEIEGERVCRTCEPGYSGDDCNKCDNGYYGRPNVECVECPCNNNLNLTFDRACDPNSGRCRHCIDSTTGRYCDECADGYYGDAERGTCTPCECFEEGSLSEQCDQQGRCECRPGIRGDKCNECSPGRWVSRGKCRPCDCFMLNSVSGECNMTSGQCQCVPGYGGRTCQGCAEGYYSQFGNCLDCECSERGSDGPGCDGKGVCTCKDGYYGDKCDQCSEAHVILDDGSCSVCGECPLKLLDKLMDANKTMNQERAQAAIADFSDKFNDIKDRIQEVEDAIPEPDDLSDLLAKLEEAQEAAADNAAKADELTPRSQQAFADASDAKRATRDVPDDIKEIEDDLEDLIDKLENFNLSPDVVESGEALQKAQDLIQEMQDRDPELKKDKAEKAKQKAQDALDAALAAMPENMAIPSIEPLPERVDAMKDKLEDLGRELANQTQQIPLIDFKVGGIEVLEKAANDTADEIKDKIADVNATIPEVEDINDAAEEAMDDIEPLDLVPLQELVNEQEEAFEDLNPRVKPKTFNCSGLQDMRNISSDDAGPQLIQEIIQAEKDLDDLRKRVEEAEKAAQNATVEADDFDFGVQDKKLALSDFDLRKAGLEPKLNDLIAREPDEAAAVEQLQDDNEQDRETLDAMNLPDVPNWSIDDPPDTLISVPDPEPRQERIDNIEAPPDVSEIGNEVPRLINDTEQAEGKKRVVVEESARVDYKLRSLWDKIEKAKRSVETILIPMRFTGDSSYARYETTMKRSAYLSVKATVKPEEEQANGGIVYLGPDRERSGADYIEVGLLGGYVVCNMNIGNNENYLVQSELPVPADAWTYIHLQRIGGFINLSVNDTVKSNVDSSTTSAFNADRAVVGKSTQGSLKGSITDVYINGERISQWLTDDTRGVNKSVWADRMISDDKDIYYFNGDDSYLAFQTMRGQSPYLRATSVTVKTASADGLVMFYGEGSEYAGDHEVFAVDLFEGNLRLHFTNAEKDLETVVVTPSTGNKFSDLELRELQAYVQAVPRAGRSRAQLRSQLGLKSFSIPGMLSFGNHPDPASTYFGMVPRNVQNRFPSAFGEDGISTTPFTGCMSPQRINNIILRQSNVVTARNMKNGCPDTLVSSLSIKEEGSAQLVHAPLGDISFRMATYTRSGNIIYAGNSNEDYVLVAVEEGKLAVKLVVGGESVVVRGRSYLNSGSERFIRIVFSEDQRVTIYVDDIQEGGVTLPGEMFQLEDTQPIYLGLLPAELDIRGAGYTGCISDLVIRDKIFSYTFDAVKKTNIILDRCRTIRSVSEDPTPEAELPGELRFAEEPVAVRSCSILQPNMAPDSFLVSSQGGSMNYIKIDDISSNRLYVRYVLEFVVSTVSTHGVLLFVRSDDGKEVSLKFDSDKVTLTFTMATPLEIVWQGTINDGRPHRVKILRAAYRVELVVDGESLGEEMAKVGRTEHSFLLAQNNELDSCSNGICIGGAPASINGDERLGYNLAFVGCFSGIALNQQPYDDRRITKIGDVPQCAEGAEMSTAHYFNGQASIVPDVTIANPDTSIFLQFRSSKQTGSILTLLGPDDSAVLDISLDNEKVVIRTNGGTEEIVQPDQDADMFYFCDGDFHTLSVSVGSASVSITVDDGEATVGLNEDGPYTLRIGDQFLGCVQDPNVDGAFISLANPRSNSGVLLESCPSGSY